MNKKVKVVTGISAIAFMCTGYAMEGVAIQNPDWRGMMPTADIEAWDDIYHIALQVMQGVQPADVFKEALEERRRESAAAFLQGLQSWRDLGRVFEIAAPQLGEEYERLFRSVLDGLSSFMYSGAINIGCLHKTLAAIVSQTEDLSKKRSEHLSKIKGELYKVANGVTDSEITTENNAEQSIKAVEQHLHNELVDFFAIENEQFFQMKAEMEELKAKIDELHHS